MFREVLVVAACVCLAYVWASPSSVETFYYQNVASSATGIREVGSTVCFHVKLVRENDVADEVYRRKAMLTVQRQLVGWISEHAPKSRILPEEVRRMDELITRFAVDLRNRAVSVTVPGRVFVQDQDGSYAYALVVEKNRLLSEAAKGVPGRTEKEIREQWKTLCRQELSRESVSKVFLDAVGCGDITCVSEPVVERSTVEIGFIEGYDQNSPVIKALQMKGCPQVSSEDVWLEGLSLTSDLACGKLRLKDAGSRFVAAFDETPGASVLWCHFGNYLANRELNHLAAIAYKNALCLAGEIGMARVLASIAESQSGVYSALGDVKKAEGFRLLSLGLN